MKMTKKLMCAFMAFCVCLGLFLIPAVPVAAATSNVPKTVHVYTGIWDDDAISINNQTPGDYLKVDSTGSKNLVAKVTKLETSTFEGSTSNPGYGCIGLYAKKDGTYTLKCSLYNRANEKVSSFQIKIVANKKYAIKKITFAGNKYTYEGKSFGYVQTKKSGKLSLALNKGFSIKKLQMTTCDKNGNEQTKTIRNNTKITLGKYPDRHEHSYTSVYDGSFSYYMSESMLAETKITVTYTDKYTKSTQTASFYLDLYAD